MSEAFVRLSRKFFDNFLWNEPRSFSRAEAWLDLVRSSAYEEQRRLVAGEVVQLPRGGVVASERFLCTRWKWSRTKVRAFINLLTKNGMIMIPQKDHKNTVFILCNYEKYNPQKDQGSDHRKTTEEPVKIPQEDQSKEIEEGNKTNKKIRKPRVGSVASSKPSIEEMGAFAVSLGFPLSDGEALFYTLDGKGWKGVVNWQSTFHNYRLNNWLASQKNGNGTRQPTKPQSEQAQAWLDKLTPQ